MTLLRHLHRSSQVVFSSPTEGETGVLQSGNVRVSFRGAWILRRSATGFALAI